MIRMHKRTTKHNNKIINRTKHEKDLAARILKPPKELTTNRVEVICIKKLIEGY